MALYDSKQYVSIQDSFFTNSVTNAEEITALSVTIPGKYKIVYGGMTNRSGGGTLSVYFEKGSFDEELISSMSVDAYSANSWIQVNCVETYLTPGNSLYDLRRIVLKADPIGSSIWYKGFLVLIRVE